MHHTESSSVILSQNAARHLNAYVAKNVDIPVDPYNVELPVKKAGRKSISSRVVPVVLPHELIFSLYHKKPKRFNEVFFGNQGDGQERLDKFWKNALRNAPWLAEHPGLGSVRENHMHCIPIGVHGDDVAYTKKGSKLMCMNWSSPILKELTMERAKMFMVGVRHPDLLSLDPIIDVLRWSFEVLLKGEMPDHDHNGNPVEGWRAEVKGMRIAGPYVFLLTHIIRDWLFLREVLDLEGRHYGVDKFCWLCSATKKKGRLSAWNFTDDAQWLSEMLTHFDFMAGRLGLAIAQWPGFHLTMVLIDLMHCLALGIYHWELGATLFELLDLGRWRKAGNAMRWKEDWAMQLADAYEEFDAYCKLHNIKHSHPAFSLNSLSMSSKSSRPYLKGKAANMLHLGSWLSAVTREYANKGDDWADARANCIYGFDMTIKILTPAPMILNNWHARKLEECRQCALWSHGYLSQIAGQRSLGRWLTKPKHHLFDHCLRIMIRDRVNVTFHWCFADESFVGLIKKIAAACHGGDALERMVAKRWVLLHATTADVASAT